MTYAGSDQSHSLRSPCLGHLPQTSELFFRSLFEMRSLLVSSASHSARPALRTKKKCLSIPPLSHLSHAPRAFVSSAIFSGPLVRVVARCMVRVYMSWPICLLLSFLEYVYLSILTLNCNLTTMSSRLPTSSLLPTLSYVAFLYQYQSTGKRCPSITSRP